MPFTPISPEVAYTIQLTCCCLRVPAGAVLLHVTTKWLLIGRYKPGVHPIYGIHYVAWWIERMLFKVRWPRGLLSTSDALVSQRLLQC